MKHYTSVKLRISEGQKDKLKKAFESNSTSITIRLTFSDLHGEDVIALTNSQVDKLVEAYEKNSLTRPSFKSFCMSVTDLKIFESSYYVIKSPTCSDKKLC